MVAADDPHSTPNQGTSQGKTCTKCGEWRVLSGFHRRSSSADGRHTQCKECLRKAARAWRQENPERAAETTRKWKQENADRERERIRKRQELYPDKHRASAKRHYEKNREQVKSKNLRYRKENPELFREYHKKWRQRHPEKVIELNRRTRAKRAKASGTFSAREWNELCVRYDNKCLCCGEKGMLTADHVVPLSKGGTNDISNIQPLCGPCNSSKHTKVIDYRPHVMESEAS